MPTPVIFLWHFLHKEKQSPCQPRERERKLVTSNLLHAATVGIQQKKCYYISVRADIYLLMTCRMGSFLKLLFFFSYRIRTITKGRLNSLFRFLLLGNEFLVLLLAITAALVPYIPSPQTPNPEPKSINIVATPSWLPYPSLLEDKKNNKLFASKLPTKAKQRISYFAFGFFLSKVPSQKLPLPVYSWWASSS